VSNDQIINAEAVNVIIPTALLQGVKSVLAGGEYTSPQQLVDEALLEWFMNHFPMSQENIDHLGKLWDEGLASGEPIAAAPLMERLRAHYTAQEAQ
jgi:antitoxin ParD1/3/4